MPQLRPGIAKKVNIKKIKKLSECPQSLSLSLSLFFFLTNTVMSNNLKSSNLNSIQSYWFCCCSVVSDSLWPHGLQHARIPLPSPSLGICWNSCPLSRWCHPTIQSSVVPFSSWLLSFHHQGLFQWFDSSHQVAKVLEFQLQHQSSQWIFRVYFI